MGSEESPVDRSETLELPAGANGVPAATGPAAPMPKQVGQYRVKSVIGSGGTGIVYLAVQEHPHRTVALKVMKTGITSASVLRRFEYESQILARMRHPSIAHVYEAGTYDDGTASVPFFAMEYIPNARAITKYARDKQLRTRELLELFVKVCEAVHHGHQKGIIHRDLKPQNILVDAAGHPRIIDFGLARATDSDLAVTTFQTDFGQLLGTVQYMSPEQCEADPHDLDTRSDVYSLGVILYELLCERRPHDLAHCPIPEAARIIREQEPPSPSSINRTLRGDVATIVLKAMAKDRDRRYQSAQDLGRDLERYLGGEPIDARPPSLSYQLRRFAGRNRTLVSGAVGILLALVLGFAATATALMREANQRRLAEQARDEAEDVTEMLAGFLSAVKPDQLGRDVLVRDVLDRASARISGELAGKPLIEARLRDTIGTTYDSLGEYTPARTHLRRALSIRQDLLGPDDPATLASMYHLARLLYDEGRYDEARPLYRDTLERCRRVLGDDHPDTLLVANGLGWLLHNEGRPEAAEPLFRRTLSAQRRVEGDTSRQTLKVMTNLAVALIGLGKLDEAEPLVKEAVRSSRRAFGEDDPDTLYFVSIQAWLLSEQGNASAAARLHEEVIDRSRRVYGEEHPHTLFWRKTLAEDLLALDRLSEAAGIARSVLGDYRRILGDGHPRTMEALGVLATALIRQDQYEQAESLVVGFFRPDGAPPESEPAPSGHACRLLAEVYEACGLVNRAVEWQARLETADDAR